MKGRKILGLFLYNLIGKHLPLSYQHFFGQTWFRRFCGKLILDSCGKKVNIEKGATFSTRCKIGDYSGIGWNAKIGYCVIGNHVMMGPECTIYTRNHKHDSTKITMDAQGFEEEVPVIIEDDVWIGGHVIILPGIKIGKGSIVGAGTVVTKNVPPYSVFCGNPGRVVKFRK